MSASALAVSVTDHETGGRTDGHEHVAPRGIPKQTGQSHREHCSSFRLFGQASDFARRKHVLRRRHECSGSSLEFSTGSPPPFPMPSTAFPSSGSSGVGVIDDAPIGSGTSREQSILASSAQGRERSVTLCAHRSRRRGGGSSSYRDRPSRASTIASARLSTWILAKIDDT